MAISKKKNIKKSAQKKVLNLSNKNDRKKIKKASVSPAAAKKCKTNKVLAYPEKHKLPQAVDANGIVPPPPPKYNKKMQHKHIEKKQKKVADEQKNCKKEAVNKKEKSSSSSNKQKQMAKIKNLKNNKKKMSHKQPEKMKSPVVAKKNKETAEKKIKNKKLIKQNKEAKNKGKKGGENGGIFSNVADCGDEKNLDTAKVINGEILRNIRKKEAQKAADKDRKNPAKEKKRC